MEAKAIESIDLIALACLIISQDHLLIDRSPGSAIPIVYDDRDGRCRGRSQQPRRRTSRCLARRLLRYEISPRYRTLSTEGAPGPPEASDVRVDGVVNHGRRFRLAEVAAMIKSCWVAFDSLRRASCA